MNAATIRQQPAHRLLLGARGDQRGRCVDRGIAWCCDPYGFARADVLIGHPVSTRLSQRHIRVWLDRIRAETVLGPAMATRYQIEVCGNPAQLIIAGVFVVAVNARAWAGWCQTGLQPSLTDRGTVIWRGNVRGKSALFGAFLPLYLGSYDRSAASTEER